MCQLLCFGSVEYGHYFRSSDTRNDSAIEYSGFSSQSEERAVVTRRQKTLMAASGLVECCVHANKKWDTDELIAVSDVRLAKLLDCGDKWLLTCKEKQRTLAEKLKNNPQHDNLHVHRQCYSDFTNLSKIPQPSEPQESVSSQYFQLCYR